MTAAELRAELSAPGVAELLSATREWVADVVEVRCGDRRAAVEALLDVDRQLLALLSGAAHELELYGGGR